MKVLIVNGIYGSRSSGRSIADIKNTLQEDGHDVYIATPLKIKEKKFYTIGNTFDHKLHAMGSRLLGLQSYFSRFATYNFLKYIDKINPDIIHVQVIHGNYLNFKMLMKYASKKQKPMVFVLDDCWYFTGKCCHYIGVKCSKWKVQCYDCPRKREDNPSWFFDFSKKMFRDKKRLFEELNNYAVVAVSDWLKNEALQSYLNNATVFTRIYNAIDVERFCYKDSCTELKKSLGLENKKIVLGVATAWKDHNGLSKGLNLFIQLADMLSEDFKIILIGYMDRDILLPSNIISIDFIDGVDLLAQYYSVADVFVQMSSEETFGKVTAEALSCGTPAIVFNSTANPELIGDKCGYVVDDKNIHQVFEKIMQVIENGKSYYSDSCRRFAVANFETKNNARRYLSVYRSLLGRE